MARDSHKSPLQSVKAHKQNGFYKAPKLPFTGDRSKSPSLLALVSWHLQKSHLSCL